MELLNQRARAAQEIGKLKRNTSLPIYEPEREKKIFENVRKANRGPLPDGELQHVYERIIDVMRNLQKTEIQPAGKRLASMGLLSGGERSLGALAFLFALMLARPSPFYVLDEVDAALDDANISRFLELIERYRERAQFIIITHQQLTMEIADVLYGVSMAGDGVSTVLSRRTREPLAV